MNGVSYVVSFFGTIMESTKSVIRWNVLDPVLGKSFSENLADRTIAKIAIAIFTLVSFGQFSSYKQSFFKAQIIYAAENTDTEFSNIDMLKKYLPAYSGKFESESDSTVSSPLCFAVAQCQLTAVAYLLNKKCSTDDIKNCLKDFFTHTLLRVYINKTDTHSAIDKNLNEERFLEILLLLLTKVSKIPLETPFDFDICFSQMPIYSENCSNFVKRIINLLVKNGARVRDRSVFQKNALCENYYNNCLAAIPPT